jgi:hypothetical protein
VRATSSIDRPAAGASAPTLGACSYAASATFGEGGAGAHLSGGPAPRHSPPPLHLPTTNPLRSPGGSPCCSRSRNSSSLYSRCSRRQIPRSLRVARSCSRRCTVRARFGPRRVHGHPLLERTKRQSHGGTWRKNKGMGRRAHSPAGCREA